MLRIIQAPHPVLAQKARPVLRVDKSIHQLINQMGEALLDATDPEGVGLAAPQIGRSIQLFVVKQSPRSPILTFINPTIESFFEEPKKDAEAEKKKKDDGVQLEGCLSLKDIWGVVKRHDGLILSYQDETGKKHTKKFDGFLAIIIQHEYDHLQGMLFPKRVLEQQNLLYKSKKNEKGESVFEEITL